MSIVYAIAISKDLGNPYELRIPMRVRFWIYLIPNVSSFICSLFVLFNLLYDRALRKALHNHIIIILLIIGIVYELISVPLMLYWFIYNETWIMTLGFAHFWTFIDYLCYSSQLVGFAWASVERHILIFNAPLLATKKKRFFIHYLPLIIFIVYCTTYYFVFVVFPFCEEFILPSPFNGVPIACVLFDPIFHKYDTISHQFTPTFLIIFMSLALFIRIIRQKRRFNRSIEWRKQKKMAIQLLSISAVYFIFMLPRTILQFCIFIGFGTNDIMVLFFHSAFFANYITFLFPYICCGAMPELAKKFRKLFNFHRNGEAVVPTSSIANDLTNKRTIQTNFNATN